MTVLQKEDGILRIDLWCQLERVKLTPAIYNKDEE